MNTRSNLPDFKSQIYLHMCIVSLAAAAGLLWALVNLLFHHIPKPLLDLDLVNVEAV